MPTDDEAREDLVRVADSEWKISMESGSAVDNGPSFMASGRESGERVEPIAVVRVQVLSFEPGQAEVELEFRDDVSDKSSKQRAVLDFAAAELARVAKEF